MSIIKRASRISGLVGLFVVINGFADGHDRGEITTVNVADDIHMLIGSGGNIGVSNGADGVLIIDDQYAPMTEKIQAAIAQITDQPVKMVLNTHWHGDHTGGNENLARAGALIIAHDNVRTRMSASHFSRFFKAEVPASPPAALPVVTFDSAVTLHVNEQTIEVRHIPLAHTDGDSIIRFSEANVVHLGDIYFNGWYPFIDVDSGGSITGMIAAVRSILPELDANTQVIPGHGPLSGKQGVIDYVEMLETVSGRITDMLSEGKSEQEIVEAKPTAEFDEQWGQGFIPPDRWVRLVYRSLTTNADGS